MNNVVVLGGGYGGATVVRELLARNLPQDIRIHLVDRMPYQGLKTEYYALAAGTISDLDIRAAYPQHPQFVMKYGEVEQIDLVSKRIIIKQEEPLSFNTLVIALGSTDNYHGIAGAPEHTCSIQSLQATRQTYQRLNNIRPYGQITIVGGGLSGVELAAELRESRADLNIRILDRGDRILGGFSNRLQQYVTKWFNDREVELQPRISVSQVEADAVHHGEHAWASDVTVWTAGIQPVHLVRELPLLKDRSNRIRVNPQHEIPDFPHVFVVGDCASSVYFPSAQLAEAMGKQVADIIWDRWHGIQTRLNEIKLRGTLGSLGKKSGFGQMGQAQMIGRVPRLLKSGILWLSKYKVG